MISLQKNMTGGIFARSAAHLGLFDAVIHRVANQMGQRVSDGFDDGFVQFHIFALESQFDLLAQTAGQIPDHPWEFIENITDGLHARQHDGFLELGSDQVDALAGDFRTALIAGGDGLHQLVTAQDQFAGQGHELVQQADVNP